MKNSKLKVVERSILFGLVFAVILSLVRFDSECEELRQNVFRLHIIANSDSESDQQLKLAVRDRILSETSCEFADCITLSDAVSTAQSKIEEIEETANSVIKEQGFDYSCNAEITDSYFDTRVYDDFTLPAGTYKSLVVKIGAAAGHNWWCVIFPGVCVPAACDASLQDTVSRESADMAYNAQKYVVKFKAVEIYENLKQRLSGAKK